MDRQLIISLLAETLGLFKATDALETPDLTIGIPSTLLCFEMAVVAVLHLRAYSWRSYRLSDPKGETNGLQSYRGGFLGVKAVFDALNPWDLVKAVGRSMKWMARGRKERLLDASYAVTPSREHEMNEDLGGLLTDVQPPAKVVRPTTHEVSSNFQVGASWVEPDVVKFSTQSRDEDLRLMSGPSHQYRDLGAQQ